MTRRWSAWGPAVVWAGVLFFLSASPGRGGPPLIFEGEDKLAHLVLYAVLGATLAWGRGRTAPGASGLLPLAVGVAYALSDEWHQSWVPGRDPSLGDLVADTVGLVLGYRMLIFLFFRRGPSPGPSSPL